MSWVSKTLKKIEKHVKPKNWLGWINPTYGVGNILYQTGRGLWNEYKENEGMYNRMGLMIAGSILTGGALGAAAGAAGLTAGGAAAGAASGAATGAITGAVTATGTGMAEHEMNEKIAEQERIQKEAQEQQERLARMEALQQAASTPGEQSFLDITGRSRQKSQIKRTQVSRSKKVGGSSSTLG